MDIREQVKFALAKNIETAAPLTIKPSATSKDSAAPDPQTTLNIAKKFDAIIRKALGKAESKAIVKVGRLQRDQEIHKPVFFMVYTIKMPKGTMSDKEHDTFEHALSNLSVGSSKRSPIQIGKFKCWFETYSRNTQGTLHTIDCIMQYTETELKNKALRGTGKLKSFMKDNSIDLKTLKTMIKYL